MSKYLRKLARYTRAILLAARDFHDLMRKRGETAEASPVLIPELAEAMKTFGRQLLGREAPESDLSGAVAQTEDISWAGCELVAEDATRKPTMAEVLATQALEVAHGRQTQTEEILSARSDLAAEQADEEKEAAAELEAKRRRTEMGQAFLVAAAAEEAAAEAEEAAARERAAREAREREAEGGRRAAAERARQERVYVVSLAVRRSKHYRTCEQPINTMRCHIRGGNQAAVLWPGAEWTTFEECNWLLAQPGVFKPPPSPCFKGIRKQSSVESYPTPPPRNHARAWCAHGLRMDDLAF